MKKIKKLKVWVNGLWFRVVIMPYMMKHKAVCSLALKDAIVYQMWYAGIGFTHINKWLVTAMKTQPIIAYVANREGKVRIFYELPEGALPKGAVRVY